LFPVYFLIMSLSVHKQRLRADISHFGLGLWCHACSG
jgi:hypothetical protein